MLVQVFGLLLIFQLSLQSDDVCNRCKSNVGELAKFIDKKDADLDKFADSVCFSQAKCKENIAKFLKDSKKGYKQKKTTPTEACSSVNLCPQPGESEFKPKLNAKLSGALLSVLNEIISLVQRKNTNWKRYLCGSCSKHLQPLTQFFIDNQAELQEKVHKICDSIKRIGLPLTGCQSFLNSLLEKARNTESPLCSYICMTPSEVESTLNQNKLKEITEKNERDAEETTEKLAKVDEMIENTQELFPYIAAGNRDANAFCTLCITFTSKLPHFQPQITEAITNLAAQLLLDEETLRKPENLQKLRQAVDQNVQKFVDKYKNTEICKSESIKACSETTYDNVKADLKTQQTKQIGCDSCQSFTSYLSPILSKQATKRDLTNYFYKEITTLIDVKVLDFFELNVFDAISHAVENLSIFLNQGETCSKTDICEA